MILNALGIISLHIALLRICTVSFFSILLSLSAAFYIAAYGYISAVLYSLESSNELAIFYYL